MGWTDHIQFSFSVGVLDIHVRSEGCEDPGKAPGTCGIAYIKVNGVDHSLHRRGHNVVIVDAKTGTISFFHISLSFFKLSFKIWFQSTV